MISRLLALRKSFTAKIIIALVVSMIFLAALFDYILISVQKKTYKASLDAQGAGLVQVLAHSIRVGVYTESEIDMASQVESLMIQEHIREVAVWNTQHKLLLHLSKQEIVLPGLDPGTINQTIQAKRRGLASGFNLETNDSFIYGGEVFFTYYPSLEDNWYMEEQSEETRKEVVGYVAIRLSKKVFHAAVRNILIQTGIWVAIFLGIGIFLTYFIVGRVTRPLQDLLLTIQKGKNGTAKQSDIGILTETYEELIQDLENSFRTIDALNENLEEKVRHRTTRLSLANRELEDKKSKLETANTELKLALDHLHKTQEQLVQQEKLAAMGQLVAGVAHEINNTVNFISGAMPSLRRALGQLRQLVDGYGEVEHDEDYRALHDKMQHIKTLKNELDFDELFPTIDQLLNNVEEGVRRTTRIISDLRTFSRSNTEKPISLDLHSVIDSTITFLDRKELDGISLHREYGAIPPVPCLPERISQVFLNIMNNGIQAMNGQGTLFIKTELVDDSVHLCFKDTGTGIAEQDMQKIFDPFFTTKEVGKGTGLGLGISYTIVRQHGGNIRVQSEVGKGTTVEVILPLQSKMLTAAQGE